MSNRKDGNAFERELCGIFAREGFWAHNFAQSAAGQPADIIIARGGRVFLIDAKICDRDRFEFRRVEENQRQSMKRFAACGNGCGWFALRFSSGIFMLSYDVIRLAGNRAVSLSEKNIWDYAVPLEEWLRKYENTYKQ